MPRKEKVATPPAPTLLPENDLVACPTEEECKPNAEPKKRRRTPSDKPTYQALQDRCEMLERMLQNERENRQRLEDEMNHILIRAAKNDDFVLQATSTLYKSLIMTLRPEGGTK